MPDTRRTLRLRCLEGESASRTAAVAKELDLGPAARAEAVHLVHDGPAACASWRQCKVQQLPQSGADEIPYPHSVLVAACLPPHKRPVTTDLFDEKARALRRQRALGRGPELFLHERAFEDVMERLALVQRSFSRALLIGCADPGWRDRLGQQASHVDVIEPEELMQVEPGSYELCVSVGVLDTASDLPRALLASRFALKPDSLAVGAFSGGDTLPALRAAMRAADESMGGASPHVHPRIEPSALAQLLSDAGFVMPVVDVDRINVSYRSLADLVRDLRSMGTTNVLAARSRRPLTRVAADAASRQFASQAINGRVTERFELLHFAAWTPSA